MPLGAASELASASVSVHSQEHQPIHDGEAGAYFFQDQAQHNEAAHAQTDEASRLLYEREVAGELIADLLLIAASQGKAPSHPDPHNACPPGPAGMPGLPSSLLKRHWASRSSLLRLSCQAQVLGPADMPGLPPECFKVVVVGQQAVSKGRQGSQALNQVQVRGEEGGSFQILQTGVRGEEEGRGWAEREAGRDGLQAGWQGAGRVCRQRQRQQHQQLLRLLLMLLHALFTQRYSCWVPLPQPAGTPVRGSATAARQRCADHAQFPHLHQRTQRSGRARRRVLGGRVLGGCALSSGRDAVFNEPCLLPARHK